MQNLDLRNFQGFLDQSRSVVVLLPQNPQMDSVAAALALALSLREAGKDVTTACPSPMLVEFNRLIGVDKVASEIENRNMVISFRDYDATGIERVSYNIENGKFTLIVVPKPGAVAPTKDQIDVSFSGTAADLVLVLGAQSKDQLGKFGTNEDLWGDNVRLAVVGNTSASDFAGAIELVNPAASSVSETTFGLVEGLGLPINQDFATNLFAGLRAGTDGFQINVTADTFAVASRLMRAGARSQPVQTEQLQPAGQPQQPAPKEWLQQPKVFKGSTLP